MAKARISKAAQSRVARDERRAIKAATSTKAADTLRKIGGDGYQNWAQSLGLGTDNALSNSTYGFNPITRIRTLLEWIYRGSWLGAIAIDIIAEDMTKAGIEIMSTMPPKDVENLQHGLVKRGVWEQLCEATKWSRLYGGAIAFMMIDGHDPSTPLNIDRVGKDAFKGLLVLDRWMIEPNLQDLVTDQGPEIGQPKFYKVVADAPAFRLRTLHHSRCIRLEGVRLPYWQRLMENMWGLSVFEQIYDRMVSFDSATMGMAQLVYKSYVRTYKIDGMRALMAEGGIAEASLMRWVEITRRLQGNEGITLIDAKDDFIANGATAFTGISEAVLQLIQQLAGALQIPLTRFMGQSPAGMNSTGESDLRTYYDGINQRQETQLRMGMTKILYVTAKSEQVKVPDDFWFVFRPLWQLTEAQKSEVFARDAAAITDLESAGTIPLHTALQELRQLSRVTGRMSNITDEQIKDAEDNPPPRPGDMLDDTDQGLDLNPEDRGDPMGGRTRGAAEARPNGKVNGRAVNGNGARSTARDAMPAIEFQGMPIVVEWERGSRRDGGTRIMPAAYGYIRGTDSAERGDQMDCFVGPQPDARTAYIIDSFKGDRFDEHKVMLGFASEQAARLAFEGSYDQDFRQPRAITPVSIDNLKAWLATGDVTQPYARFA